MRNFCITKKAIKKVRRAREMVQWLRPLAVFPEDQGSMLRTDMLAHSYLTLIPGDLMLSSLLASVGTAYT